MNVIEENYTPEEMAAIRKESGKMKVEIASRTSKALNFFRACECGADKMSGATFCDKCWDLIPAHLAIRISTRWTDLTNDLEEAKSVIEESSK